MKALSIFLLSIFLVSLVIYIVPPYRQQVEQVLSYSKCDTPISYTIGSVDPRFGLTRDVVLQDTTQATGLWSSAEGKNVFMYASQAPVTVNFVYDQRQALNTAIDQLNTKLSQNNITLEQQIAAYKAQVATFEQQLAAFNAKVSAYNQKGGVPPAEYDGIVKEQNDLKATGDKLNAWAKELNISTNTYNANVSVLHQDINQFHAALAVKPEEGLYNEGNHTITIFFADNHKELLHTLAHEFGHALGMEHVKDPTAIMYPYTTGSFLVTGDDMQQLRFVCRKQSLLLHELEVFDIWLITTIQSAKQIVANK